MTKSAKLTAVALSVFRLNGLLIEWGNTFSEPHGLTSARWQVLGAIAMATEAPSIPQIADAMGITRQSVQRIADLLVDRGLAEYLDNPAHRRAKLVAPTAEGRAAIARIDPDHAATAARLAELMDRERLAEALSALTSLTAALDRLDPGQD